MENPFLQLGRRRQPPHPRSPRVKRALPKLGETAHTAPEIKLASLGSETGLVWTARIASRGFQESFGGLLDPQQVLAECPLGLAWFVGWCW